MAKLNDIAVIADALEKPAIIIDQDRCVKVRNRNATCTACMDICHEGAIEITANEIHFTASLCGDCGACTVVCPTEALRSATVPNEELIADGFRLSEERGRAIFACARIASKRQGDPETYREVPCLGHIRPSLLLALGATDVQEILLVDGDCSTCKFGWCDPSTQAVVDEVSQLLASGSSPCSLERRTGFPEAVLLESPEGHFGTSRRGFFGEAAAAVKDTALSAAQATMKEKLGAKAPVVTLAERLRVNDDGTMAHFPMVEHERAINALDLLAIPPETLIDSSLFGRVTIDPSTCNVCKMCAVFCPTGAIAEGAIGPVSKQPNELLFSASECVQCNLCSDVCWRNALEVSSAVPASELFDFEPVVFDVKPKKRPARNALGNKNPF